MCEDRLLDAFDKLATRCIHAEAERDKLKKKLEGIMQGMQESPFKVGRVYKTKEGKDVEIVLFDPEMGFPLLGKIKDDYGHAAWLTWYANGDYSIGSQSQMDLIFPKEDFKQLWVDHLDLQRKYKELTTKYLEAEKLSQSVVESISAHCMIEQRGE